MLKCKGFEIIYETKLTDAVCRLSIILHSADMNIISQILFWRSCTQSSGKPGNSLTGGNHDGCEINNFCLLVIFHISFCCIVTSASSLMKSVAFICTFILLQVLQSCWHASGWMTDMPSASGRQVKYVQAKISFTQEILRKMWCQALCVKTMGKMWNCGMKNVEGNCGLKTVERW